MVTLEVTSLTTLSFHGAAGCVTGSKYLLDINGTRLLIDCGFFQGHRKLRQLNWKKLPFEPEGIDVVLLTHAHIDHVGFLPRLVKFGFKGDVYCTAPTSELAEVSLLDSAHIQEEDAEWRNRKKVTRHKKALPLYTSDDVIATVKLFKPTPYKKWITINENIRFKFHVIGHILGAASIEIEYKDNGVTKSILFSGDIGRYGNPLTLNPEPPPECDYLVCESTYGGRLHEPEDPRALFIDLLNEIIEQKSILIIPAFAVSRTQQITYLVNELIKHKMIPSIDIHLDSPMAITATEIYCKYHTFHSIDLNQFGGDDCILGSKNVVLHRSRKSSMKLNKLKGPAIIMSSSGMLTGGRVLHHLINRLPSPDTTVLLAGYMAEGTLGRRLSDGEPNLYIHKQLVEVKAKVIAMHGLSGHADYYEILHWLDKVKKSPKRVFLTHGEKSQSRAMAEHLKREKNWECHLPELGETVQL